MFEFKIPKNLKKRKISLRVKQEVEPQEVLLDALSQREEAFARQRLETPLVEAIVKSFSILFVLVLVLFCLKAFQLQILNYKEFKNLSDNNYQKIVYQRADRGAVYDRNLKQLVFNESSFDLVGNKNELFLSEIDIDQAIDSIARIIKLDSETIKEKFRSNDDNRVLIAEDLDFETLAILDSKIANLSGFLIEENIKRSYVSGPVFSHIVGFLGRIEQEELDVNADYSHLDYIGKSGLEKSYESVLRGEKGETIVVKDVFSHEILRQDSFESSPGNSLVLWLDAELQEIAHQSLQDSITRVGAKAGAVVAMDPRNGGILALSSLPSFDNNLFFERLDSEQWQKIFKNPFNPFWNRITSATYPTGSTIKPLIAAAALEEGVVDSEKGIFCEGLIKVPNPWFPDEPWIFHDNDIHGWTNVKQAIAKSCNVFFYTIGGGHRDMGGLGEERIKQYLEKFGWGFLTNIDLPGEKKGLIPSREWKKEYFDTREKRIWYPGDTYNLSIGQGYVAITPLQVVTSFGAIANGGILYEPMVVKQVVDEKKNIIQEFDPTIISQDFISSETLEIVQRGMREGVIYGSSTFLGDLPVKAAAKTGTAQTSQSGVYHNWITVFAPYENPEIVITVVIESVPDQMVAALPVAKEVLNWYFLNK